MLKCPIVLATLDQCVLFCLYYLYGVSHQVESASDTIKTNQ